MLCSKRKKNFRSLGLGRGTAHTVHALSLPKRKRNLPLGRFSGSASADRKMRPLFRLTATTQRMCRGRGRARTRHSTPLPSVPCIYAQSARKKNPGMPILQDTKQQPDPRNHVTEQSKPLLFLSSSSTNATTRTCKTKILPLYHCILRFCRVYRTFQRRSLHTGQPCHYCPVNQLPEPRARHAEGEK